MSETNETFERTHARLEMVRKAYNNGTLIKGEDYGVIPGSSKPTLFKPGAQKICALCDLATEIKEIKRIWTPELISYEVTVTLRNKATGGIEGEGAGCCNSQERKYKNKPAPDMANTLLKMAKKRGMVDATLDATGISSLFTQDIEDMDLTPEPAPFVAPQRAPEPLATEAELATYSNVRELAVALGYRTGKGNEPIMLDATATQRDCLARTAALESEIKKIEADEEAGRAAAQAAEKEELTI